MNEWIDILDEKPKEEKQYFVYDEIHGFTRDTFLPKHNCFAVHFHVRCWMEIPPLPWNQEDTDE